MRHLKEFVAPFSIDVQSGESYHRSNSFIEPKAVHQVFFGGVEDLDLHLVSFRIRRFASVHGSDFVEPSWSRVFLAISTSACHEGEGMLSGVRSRTSQISSRARSFSEMLILSRGKALGIRAFYSTQFSQSTRQLEQFFESFVTARFVCFAGHGHRRKIQSI